MSVIMAPVRRLAERDPDLAGCEVVVLGLGVSGLAAVRLAVARHARVTVVDNRDEEALGDAAREVRSLGARLHTGGNPAALANAADLVVVSPGVPSDNPLLRRARELELPVWSEIELAARYCKGRVVGVTGSNGKSTVTTMIGSTLRTAGISGGTGGNLATPFADLLESDAEHACHVVELSSFQLETTLTLRADVAVVLNLSPDHLDRHATFEAYGQAKARLIEMQDDAGHAVVNADDPALDFMRDLAGDRLYEFSTVREVPRGAFVRDGWIVVRTEAGDEPVIEAARLPVPGEHNLANALAAAIACRLAGCPTQRIAEGLEAYRALPHRLEAVGWCWCSVAGTRTRTGRS
jgi:UDP-N-acetylmuramoylalanine--D-glutamate ligase